MKSTGIVRRVDELGRVVIPVELRRTLEIEDKVDSLEIFVDGENVVLRKYKPSCVFCSSMDALTEYKEKKICSKCAKKIGVLAE